MAAPADSSGVAKHAASRQLAPAAKPVDASTSAPNPTRGHVADPAVLTIPAIDVDASMVGVGLLPNGEMQTPAYDSNLAGWYVEGPRPGQPGPAVIVAHVDSKTGPDVFYRLRELRPGDRITVTDSADARHTFTVERLERADRDGLPYGRIWTGGKQPVLRLITCAGPYDRANGGYQQNLIVYAH
ncbi:class F sortase [Actinopolymorpha cephalotaxi]|uniref:Sortase (Surface protein transpeptidase) n=1 Tax=Actinopolymorpha cephalotaxi TaxID=504797 RepID=A0ABX2SFR3_9ACTN|nr:class F sortase [Actinopolymorpha cephalotaxi]NYH87102.1 sortase (surface protein transpeptidase) [Actinopolymorpha cephalotaxi]